MVLIGGFLAALCTPALGMIFGLGVSKAVWFEASAPLPERPRTPADAIRFPNKLRHYFDSHFSFRVPLMNLYARLKVRIFGVSGSDTVMLGKEGWLFFVGDRITDDYRCNDPFSEAELARWTEHLVRRRDWLRRRGVPYLFVIAPNTGTIYPEKLPDSLRRFGSVSRLEQLTTYLERHSDLHPVDLRSALIQAKPRGRLYYQTDSHWNQLGGFVAYEQIATHLRRVFPTWRSRALADFEQRATSGWAGDLSYMLGAPSLFTETRTDLVPHQDAGVRSDGLALPIDESAGNWSIRPIVVRESATGEVARAVVLRDSYFGGPAQFLSSHFGRMVMLWTNDLDPSVIDRERPDVVIEEIVERNLMHPPADDPRFPEATELDPARYGAGAAPTR